jgi:hypothetical protein
MVLDCQGLHSAAQEASDTARSAKDVVKMEGQAAGKAFANVESTASSQKRLLFRLLDCSHVSKKLDRKRETQPAHPRMWSRWRDRQQVGSVLL